jgi:hypothetical protein
MEQLSNTFKTVFEDENKNGFVFFIVLYGIEIKNYKVYFRGFLVSLDFL